MPVSIYEAAFGGYYPEKPLEDQVRLAYASLVGKPPEETDFAERYALLQNPPEQFDDDAADAHIALHSLQALVSGSNNQEHPLVGWPTYKHMLNSYDKRACSSALLLGSASPLSSRGFTTLAKEELGVTEAHIIDLYGGSNKANEGIFTAGSVLELPNHYPANSKDYVLTSQLFHQLLFDPEQFTYSSAIEQVLRGAHQVLKPGGQLLLKECLPNERYDQPVNAIDAETRSMGRYLCELLDTIGFVNLWPHLPLNHADSALFDPNRDFDKHVDGRSLGVVAVYAQKT